MHFLTRTTLTIFYSFLCLACAPRRAPDDGVPKPDVEASADMNFQPFIDSLIGLRDQNDSSITPPPKGQSWVIVLGDRSLSKETQAWADKLEGDLGNPHDVVRVLSLEGVPKIAAAPLVCRGIKSQVGSKPIQVLLDWDGVVAKQFDISPTEPRILCFASSNSFVGVISGPLTDFNLQSVHGLLAHSNANKLEIAR